MTLAPEAMQAHMLRHTLRPSRSVPAARRLRAPVATSWLTCIEGCNPGPHESVEVVHRRLAVRAVGLAVAPGAGGRHWSGARGEGAGIRRALVAANWTTATMPVSRLGGMACTPSVRWRSRVVHVLRRRDESEHA